MSTNISYSILWSQQTLLLNQIAAKNGQIQDIQRTLARCDYVSTQTGSPRKAKKKAQWSRSTATRSLRHHGEDVMLLLQNLATCQAQIIAAHEATKSLIVQGESIAQSPFSMPALPHAQTLPMRVHNQTASPGVSYTLLFNGQEFWDLSDIPATPATPIIRPMVPSIDQVINDNAEIATSGSKRDSGFWESSLYAQPFDFTFEPASIETSQHVFAHELLMVSPLTLAPPPPPTTFAPSMRVTGKTSAERPEGRSPASIALDPTAKEFSLPAPVPHRQVGCTKKASVASHVDAPAKKKTKFHMPTSPTSSERSLDPCASPFAAPPQAEHIKETKHKRRYSEAAISLIESRLKDKSKQQQTPWGPKGQVYRRRGKSIADVAVNMWYYSPSGMERVEEMVWPLTA